METALSTLRRQSQRAGDGQKSAICYTGNNKKKGGRDNGYGKDRHLSGITPQGAGHDTAAGGGYIRCVQQNCQQMGVRRGAAGHCRAAGAGGAVRRDGGRHPGR